MVHDWLSLYDRSDDSEIGNDPRVDLSMLQSRFGELDADVWTDLAGKLTCQEAEAFLYLLRVLRLGEDTELGFARAHALSDSDAEGDRHVAPEGWDW